MRSDCSTSTVSSPRCCFFRPRPSYDTSARSISRAGASTPPGSRRRRSPRRPPWSPPAGGARVDLSGGQQPEANHPHERDGALASLEPRRPSNGRAERSPLDAALEPAAMTAEDGAQRAVEHIAGDLEDLLSLRLAIREALASSPPTPLFATCARGSGDRRARERRSPPLARSTGWSSRVTPHRCTNGSRAVPATGGLRWSPVGPVAVTLLGFMSLPLSTLVAVMPRLSGCAA